MEPNPHPPGGPHPPNYRIDILATLLTEMYQATAPNQQPDDAAIERMAQTWDGLLALIPAADLRPVFLAALATHLGGARGAWPMPAGAMLTEWGNRNAPAGVTHGFRHWRAALGVPQEHTGAWASKRGAIILTPPLDGSPCPCGCNRG